MNRAGGLTVEAVPPEGPGKVFSRGSEGAPARPGSASPLGRRGAPPPSDGRHATLAALFCSRRLLKGLGTCTHPDTRDKAGHRLSLWGLYAPLTRRATIARRVRCQLGGPLCTKPDSRLRALHRLSGLVLSHDLLAAVHVDDIARDPTGPGRAEGHHGIGHVLGSCEAA
jgi:hypothetical protein